jgi:hypothetical protein
MSAMIEYLETGDVGRTLDRTGAVVRYHIGRGRLHPAARTMRGTLLFRLEDVETLRRWLRKKPKATTISAR